MIIEAGFEHISSEMVEKFINQPEYEDVNFMEPDLPSRATRWSAGYDIIAPMDIALEPEESIVVPTFLKCYMPDGWMLNILPKSGLGFTCFVRLANTVGLIDCDYYNNVDNEGHILVKIRNEGDRPLFIAAGRAFCQGVFVQYGVCLREPTPRKTRTGGFGSTNS